MGPEFLLELPQRGLAQRPAPLGKVGGLSRETSISADISCDGDPNHTSGTLSAPSGFSASCQSLLDSLRSECRLWLGEGAVGEPEIAESMINDFLK